MLSWCWRLLSEAGASIEVSGRSLRRFPAAEVDRLLRARVLVERRRARAWRTCPDCSCGLPTRPVREVDGVSRACCPLDPAADEPLDEDDLRRFAVDPDRLAAEIAASGGLTGEPLRLREDVWLLGATREGRAIVLCGRLEGVAAPGTLAAVRTAAPGADVQVLAPETDPAAALRLREAGVEVRDLADGMACEAGRERLAPERLATGGREPRLVVGRLRPAAALDGRRLDLPPQLAVLLRMLATAALERDGVLSKVRIETETGRASGQFVRDLRRALARRGLTQTEAEALVVNVRGFGYRLGLPRSEIRLAD